MAENTTVSSNDGMISFVLNAVKQGFSELNTSNMATITAIGEDKSKIDVTIDSTKQELPDVPFITLQGGSQFLQFPISVGDKCLLIFSKDTVEDWLGGTTDFIFNSDFDMNNAFALVGINDNTDLITIEDYVDFKVNKIKIRNDSEELITLLSDTLKLLSDTNDTLGITTVGGTPIDQQAIFSGYKTSADALKIKIDTFKV